MDWGPQSREPQNTARILLEYTCLGPYVAMIFLLYSWGSLLRGPVWTFVFLSKCHATHPWSRTPQKGSPTVTSTRTLCSIRQRVIQTGLEPIRRTTGELSSQHWPQVEVDSELLRPFFPGASAVCFRSYSPWWQCHPGQFHSCEAKVDIP